MCRSVDLWDLHFGGRCDDNDDNYQNEYEGRPVLGPLLLGFRFIRAGLSGVEFRDWLLVVRRHRRVDTNSKVINGEQNRQSQVFKIASVCRAG